MRLTSAQNWPAILLCCSTVLAQGCSGTRTIESLAPAPGPPVAEHQDGGQTDSRQVIMSADGFVVFYGLKFEIPSEYDAIEALERETDERLVRATQHGLDHYFGRLTDGAPYHLFIGRTVGDLGIEGESYKALSAEAFNKMATETRKQLAAAGFEGEPVLHFQLEAEY